MTTSSSSGLHVGENVQCKGLSSVVQIKYSETFGRHMIASEDIPAGSLLIDEVPYALTIDQGCEQFYCDWCTKAFDDRRTVLKCDRCKEDTLNWCSPECRRQADESYHGMECGKIRTWIEQFHMHGVLLAVRIVARLKWNEIDLDSILDDKTKSSDEDNGCTIQTPSDHIRSLLRLTSDEETISGPEKCAITTLATRIIQEIHERDHMKSTTKESRFPSQLPAAGLMTRFLEQLIHRLARNRQGLWEHQTFQDVELSKLIRKTDGHKACALYPNAALLNHACRPNVYPTYGENGRIQIRNIRQLKSGEQLLHCYGMKFGEMARAQRQKSLSAQYYFTCACEACTSQEASKAEFESESFFCEICHKVLNTHNGECPTEPDEHPNRMQILGRFEADNKTLSNLDEKSIRTLIEQMMQLEPLCHANNKRLCDLRKEAAEALLKIGQHKRWHYYHRPMVLVEVRLISSRSQVACAQYNNYDNYNSNQYGGPPGRGFGRGRDENLEPCQCSTFDPCVQQEWQKMEQCAMRTCPAQVFDQLHQDWMKCWSDVPQADQRLIQCVEGQIGKSCQGGSVRGKRQTRPGNNNANYYNVQYQQQQPSSGAGSETGFDRLFATIQNGLGQWQAYGECMQTCMNTTRQRYCRLIKPTFDQVQTAIQTCSNQLGINWRDEAITKCRCLEALGTSWISCNTLELFSSQIDDATILEMASTYMAVMAGAE